MSNSAWSRNEKIALISLLFVIISCIAAIVVVPEIRHWLGLDAQIKAIKTSNKNENTANIYYAESSPENPATNSNIIDKAQPSILKLSGVSFAPNVYTKLYRVDRLRNATILQVQLIDMALYNDRKIYIKLSLCNVGNIGTDLYEWYIWYTPSSRQDSINWSWNEDPSALMSLKPGACKTMGGWSEKVDDSFKLTKPLGVINISDDGYKVLSTIDLNTADSQGFVNF